MMNQLQVPHFAHFAFGSTFATCLLLVLNPLLGASWHCHRSAGRLGRSKPRLLQPVMNFARIARFGACCGRDGPRSAAMGWL